MQVGKRKISEALSEVEYAPKGMSIISKTTIMLEIIFRNMVQANVSVFAEEMESTQLESIGACKAYPTIIMTKDSMTNGSTITETIQMSGSTYAQYAMFQDTMNNTDSTPQSKHATTSIG